MGEKEFVHLRQNGHELVTIITKSSTDLLLLIFAGRIWVRAKS